MGGPADLPFDHPDVRVYVDTLFVEGILQPVDWPGLEGVRSSWLLLGIRRDPDRDRSERLASLLQIVDGELPQPDVRHGAWLEICVNMGTTRCSEQPGHRNQRADCSIC